MKPEDWDVLATYVRAIADHIGLRDWLLVLKHDVPAEETSLASVIAVEGRRFGAVRVCKEFRELTADEQRQVILHELLHCHLAEAHWYLGNVLPPLLGTAAAPIVEGHRLKIEYAVDAVAQEWARQFGHIEWTTADPTREESANAPYEGPTDRGAT